MRKFLIFLAICVNLFFPTIAYAQDPDPPPSLAEICYSEEKLHPLECLIEIGNIAGVGGMIIFLLFIFFVYYFLSPSGKGLYDTVKDKSSEIWIRIFPWLRPTVPLTDLERREAEDKYLYQFEKSEAIRQPDEIAARFNEYLQVLHGRENPLQPSEDSTFVELESGLSIPQRIGLSKKIETQQTKSIAEIKTFTSLEEAVKHVDERTGMPFASLALLGEPGAGKSTLLRKFARQLVQERIADPTKPLPIYALLSAYKNRSPMIFLRQHWNKMLGFEGFEDELASGKVWLILDGLNEMPRADYQHRVEEWREFLRRYVKNGSRALMACREADYGEGVDVPILTIHPMDDERIQEFLKKRKPEIAEVLWNSLEKDRDEARGAIYDLAKIPFWLEMLLRYSEKGDLPRNRADLIESSIREWLDYERTRPQGRVPSELQRDAFLEGITRLAWVGLSRSQNFTFSKSEALNLISKTQAALKADDVLGLAQDCSLISQEGDTVRFQHQLLQEYFAARELARQFSKGKNLSKLWKTPWRNLEFVQSEWTPLPPPPQTFWEEAIILAVGMLDTQAGSLTLRILQHNPPLAARCALEAGIELNANAIKQLKKRLQADLQNPRVRLPARLAAGKALAKLSEVELVDDKKITYIVPDWLEVPAGRFQMGTTPVQALMLKIQRADALQSEMPAHNVFVSAFRMARYPVTVAEYRCFIGADGYQNDAYWKQEHALQWRNAPLPYEESYQYKQILDMQKNRDAYLRYLEQLERQKTWSPAQIKSVREMVMNDQDDEGLRKQWEENEAEKRDDNGRVVQPWVWDNQKYTVANQPVIGVSWYEACAYTVWLTEVLRKQNTISELDEIRLPTEAEWEKAARGASGRLWAWGNLWNSSYANSLEGRVMQPSSVGAYPQNKSPYGVEDMIGNVWEWCLDWYKEDEYQRSSPVDKERIGKEVKDPFRAEGEPCPRGARRFMEQHSKLHALFISSQVRT